MPGIWTNTGPAGMARPDGARCATPEPPRPLGGSVEPPMSPAGPHMGPTEPRGKLWLDPSVSDHLSGRSRTIFGQARPSTPCSAKFGPDLPKLGRHRHTQLVELGADLVELWRQHAQRPTESSSACLEPCACGGYNCTTRIMSHSGNNPFLVFCLFVFLLKSGTIRNNPGTKGLATTNTAMVRN